MKANLASELKRALKFRFKFQIKTARMSCVLSFVARRKISPHRRSRADASFDDTGPDGAILADAIFDDASFDGVKKRGRVARRIHKKFCFKFYIDLPRTPRAPRRGRNSALNLPRAATLPPFTTLPHITTLPRITAGGRLA